MNDIKCLKIFLQERYPNIKAYCEPISEGRYSVKVYDRHGIEVDYVPILEYVEIFGLTNCEFRELVDENGFLKTFEIKRRKNENKS